MLESFEIHNYLDHIGYKVEKGKNNPSYAFEHHLGNATYVYVKRKDDRKIKKSPLVIHPCIIKNRIAIDAIDGIHINWSTSGLTKSSSYRRFPKFEGIKSQYGYAVDVSSEEALKKLIKVLAANDYADTQPLNFTEGQEPRDLSQAALWALQRKLPTKVKQSDANKKPDLDEGKVYAISIPSYPGILKIGYTGNITQRLSSLQVAVPEEICLEFDTKVCKPLAVETMAHFLAGAPVRGEWFKMDLKKAKEIIERAKGLIEAASEEISKDGKQLRGNELPPVYSFNNHIS